MRFPRSSKNDQVNWDHLSRQQFVIASGTFSGPWAAAGSPVTSTSGLELTIPNDGVYTLEVFASAFMTVGTALGELEVYIDGVLKGYSRLYFDSLNEHKFMVPFVLPNIVLSAGVHSTHFRLSGNLSADAQDYGSLKYLRQS